MAPLLYTLALLLTRALAAPGVTSSTTPLPENVCGMPLETGRCDAIKHRFAFDAAKNECVSFVYGGCGGNGNNFVSLADCQAACPKKTSLAAAPTAAVKPVTQEEMPQADQPPTPAARATCAACPNEAYLTHYQELGCQPIFSEDNKCCAVRYDCGNRALQSKDKCYHEGKAYEIGSEIPNDATPSCLVHCRCTQTEFDKAPRMNCISIECPELFEGPLSDSNCIRQYSRSKCCSQNTYCAPAGSTLESATNVAHCSYDGQSYVEGEKFYPENEPCLVCICQKGFNGTLSEPHCQRAKCNIELHYSHYLRRQCVPIYYKDRCCPIDWSCPNGNHQIETTTEAASTSISTAAVKPTSVAVSTKESKEDETTKCVFGNQTFDLDEELPQEVAGDCVTCKCLVPPVPTCVKDYDGCNRN